MEIPIHQKSSMDTIKLDQLLVNVSGFIGACPFDELPVKPSTDFSVIINTDSSEGPGEHWLAIVRKGPVYYFHDSYGREPNDMLFTAEFRDKMDKYINGNCVSNTKWIQQIVSNVCGHHSAYFIREMENNDFGKVLSVFTGNLKNNDEFVLRYVKSI